MEIAHFALGPIGTNCYVLYEPKSWDCIVIDPGDEAPALIRKLEKLRLTPKFILLTHGHPDHFGGVAELKIAFPEAVMMMHEADHDKLNMDGRQLMPSARFAKPECDAFYKDGDELACGNIRLRVAHTPGHSPGGVCLIPEGEGCVFAGDTLFCGSVGRSDFPGGDFEKLEQSIRGKLYVLPPDTVVFPGHGTDTTIGQEMRANPFVRG